MTTIQKTTTYGTLGYAEGFISTDKVTFKKTPSQADVANKVGFVLIYSQHDLTLLLANGVLGLGPNKDPSYKYDTILKQFKAQSVIKDNTFALFLGRTGVESSI